MTGYEVFALHLFVLFNKENAGPSLRRMFGLTHGKFLDVVVVTAFWKEQRGQESQIWTSISDLAMCLAWCQLFRSVTFAEEFLELSISDVF